MYKNTHEQQKILLRRIDHLGLLIGQIRDEIKEMGIRLPCNLYNRMQKLVMHLENTRQNLAHLVNIQDDINLQKQGAPLIIKED